MSFVQPTKANLIDCTVGGVPFINGQHNNFHVQELRIFEDHCKAYFTGQLVIEAHQNTWEIYVSPGAVVSITFEAPRSDGGQTSQYTEQFRIYSYESKPRENDVQNSMVITLSLIGQEYFNDKQNTVLQSFANVPGTFAAAAIHEEYVAANGGLVIDAASLGMIGLQQVPHEVNNKKPIKAIHDILDKCVFAAYPSCAPVYFRDKPGYVMAPLQALLENAAVVQSFSHTPTEGTNINNVQYRYDRIIDLRPMSPPSTDKGGGAGGIGGLSGALAFFDLKSGNYLNNFQSIDQVIAGLGGSFQGIANGFKSGIKGRYGGRASMAVLDEKHQPLSVSKNGPGGFANAEDAFLAQLGFTPKYWVSVPLQTGVNVTCGKRINIVYPVAGEALVAKTVYVARLIHQLKFSEGRDRKPVTIIGTTDMFTVHWGE